jgi:formate/nitrite transporter FocA (FNT family)
MVKRRLAGGTEGGLACSEGSIHADAQTMSSSEKTPADQEAQRKSTEEKQAKAEEHQRLSAVTLFETIRREGDEELNRPVKSLWWSGIAAGLALSSSVLAEGILSRVLAGNPAREVIAALGYALGFVIVILSRLQLFTENTISVVLPVLAKPSADNLWRSARLWTVVLAANLVGTFVTAFISLKLGTTSPENSAAMLEVSRKVLEQSGWTGLIHAIPAGFFIASIVWMLPSSKGFEIVTITVFAWLIAAGAFSHVVVGSSEVFLLAIHGELGFWTGISTILLPALVGNVIGGTGLFALLAYGQVEEEIR